MKPADLKRRIISASLTSLSIGAFTFLLLEASLQVLLRTNTLKIHGVIQHPNISRDLFADYIRQRNSLVGWPSHLAHAKLFTSGGHRPSPENQRLQGRSPCATIFGDSQGYGLDVNDSQAWSNVLAKKLSCPVHNYSVPAYGTDQALLRYEQVKQKSGVAILTFIDDDIRRNLIQYWDLAYGPIYLERTKPRFILNDSGDLELIPLPVNTFAQARELNNWSFSELMRYETFAPSSTIYRTAFKPSFPYSLSLSINAVRQVVTKHSSLPIISNSWLLRLADTRLDPIASINKTSSLELQSAILDRFVRTCKARSQRCLVVRLNPSFQDPTKEASSPISSYLESSKSLAGYLVKSDYMATCMNKILVEKWKLTGNIDRRQPGGHYGEETNDALAECITPLIKGEKAGVL